MARIPGYVFDFILWEQLSSLELDRRELAQRDPDKPCLHQNWSSERIHFEPGGIEDPETEGSPAISNQT